jgi:hypothetical protein
VIVAPGSSFIADVSGFATGLTGTLGVRVLDASNGAFLARTTVGIAESPAASGRYAVTLTAPPFEGRFRVVWDDGTNYAADGLVVSAENLDTVAAGASFLADVSGFSTGLVGTLGLQIVNGSGAVVLPRSTAGVAEFPGGSGLYTATPVAPATAGAYVVVWDDGVSFAYDDLTVVPADTSGAGNVIVLSGANFDASTRAVVFWRDGFAS